MEKLIVTIATPLYPPDIGGPATYTKLLEDKLPERGFVVRVVSFGGSRHLPKGIRHLHYFWKLFIKAKGSNVVFAQDPVSVGLPALFAARLRRAVFIIRMPGDYAWEQSSQRFGVVDDIDTFQVKRYGTRVEWLRRLQRYVSQRAERIITPSEYFRKLVIGWGVPDERVTTIYNGVDFSEQPKFIDKPDGLTVVTAARLVPWKGIAGLIRSLAALPEWTLRVLGDGPERSRLEQLANELDVSDQVVFMGSRPHAEVLGWCKAADAFALNTHFESFSFQIVEAMMCGTPVITTNVGSVPELITSGEEGILLEPDDLKGIQDALRGVATEVQLWQERTDKAQKKATQFSIENTVVGVEKLLRGLV